MDGLRQQSRQTVTEDLTTRESCLHESQSKQHCSVISDTARKRCQKSLTIERYARIKGRLAKAVEQRGDSGEEKFPKAQEIWFRVHRCVQC